MDLRDGYTLCTFYTGPASVLVVLHDWLDFLPVKPRSLRFVTTGGTVTPADVERQAKTVPVDFIDLPRTGTPMQMNCTAVYKAVSESPTRMVVLVKLDALPYREGEPDWLDRALAEADRLGAWAVSGCMYVHDTRPVSDRYGLTGHFSENFAVIDRDRWLEAMREGDVAAALSGGTDDDRYAMEALIEGYIHRHGLAVLLLADRPSWSVQHVNCWGDRLLSVRERYRRRVRVAPYFNRSTPLPCETWDMPEWRLYYGWPRPSWVSRFRVWAGKSRRRLMGRCVRCGRKGCGGCRRQSRTGPVTIDLGGSACSPPSQPQPGPSVAAPRP